MKYRDLIGAPYKLGGCGPAEFDCAGLAIELQRRQGREIATPAATPAEEASQLVAMSRIIRSGWREVRAAGFGALVFFPSEGHVGTMLDAVRFLHTTSEVGDAHIDSLKSVLWRTKRRAFYVPL